MKPPFSAKELRNDFLAYFLHEYLIENDASQNYDQSLFDAWHRLILLLLNDKTIELIYEDKPSEFWSYSRFSLQNLLERISVLAPNLEALTLTYVNDRSFPSPFSQVKQPLMNLRALIIYKWLWSDHDLDLMTRNVPNLDELEVRMWSKI
jgi:hypothetical protein